MAGEIKQLLRPHLADVQTYEAVDPPELIARRAGIPESEIVKLNGNENPYGGSPKVAEAVASAPVHIYPDPLQRKVRSALSEYTGAAPEEIVAGAGSDELIDLMFRLFMEPGTRCWTSTRRSRCTAFLRALPAGRPRWCSETRCST